MPAQDTTWLATTEARTWWAYRQMKQLVDGAVEADLRADSDLSDADYHVLSTLGETPLVDWRLRTLADRLMWTRPRLAHQLRRMGARGLVERPPRDGAAGPGIVLSSIGLRRIQEAAPHHVRSVRRHFLDHLTPEQQRQFAEMCEHVAAQVRLESDSGWTTESDGIPEDE